MFPKGLLPALAGLQKWFRKLIEVDLAGVNVMDIYRKINEQSFYEGCSSSAVNLSEEERSYFEELFYLNPQQQQVLQSQDRRLVIAGEVGTGKTVLLMLKALIAMRNGEKVVFLVPKCLKAKYNSFKAKYGHLGNCSVMSFEENLQTPFPELGNTSLYIDEWQTFLTPRQQGSGKTNPYKLNNHQETSQHIISTLPSKTIVVMVVDCFFGKNTFHTSGKTKNLLSQHFITHGFQVFHLTTILRGTHEIVNKWSIHFNSSSVTYHSVFTICKDHISPQKTTCQLFVDHTK